jgi:DNA-binding NarL/FixJ family response regulator
VKGATEDIKAFRSERNLADASDVTTDGEARRSAVVFDQHALWLEAIEGVLVRAGVDVVGKSTNVEAALTLVIERRPDILVIDTETADGQLDGLTYVRMARERAPSVRCVVLSGLSDPESIAAAFAAGAAAYVTKKAYPDDLAFAVRQSFEHSVYMSLGELPPAPALPLYSAPVHDPLTNREREILLLVSEGRSNAQLARMLWVTEQTIKFHLSNIYRKLDVANRTEAARWAQLNGLLQPVSEPISA